MIKIVILGAGNVSSHLINAFSSSSEAQVVQVYNHNPQTLNSLSFDGNSTTQINHLHKADVYILAVADDVIKKMTRALPFKNRLVIHTSGSVSINDIHSKNRRGVFYPLQTFSKSRKVNFSEVPFCIEAENETDVLFLKRLAGILSKNVLIVDSERRKQLHLAAVFVCNFVNYLYHVGYELTTSNDLPFDLLLPLINETAAKINTSVPEKMQTGPAKRNDKKTMKKHLDALVLPQHKSLYKLLSKSIQENYGGKKL